MRHFLALPVSLLPHRVHPPTASAPLVALARGPLAVAPRVPRTRPPAVLRSRHVTRQAQRHRPAASRVPTDDDVQRDHGPLRCQARHPRGPVRPKTGRTATSRSGGAIEGTEGPASVSSLCASHPRLHDGDVAGAAPTRRGHVLHRDHHRDVLRRDRRLMPWRRLVLFAAIRGDHLCRDQQAQVVTRVRGWHKTRRELGIFGRRPGDGCGRTRSQPTGRTVRLGVVMAPEEGFEPPTRRLTAACSTD